MKYHLLFFTVAILFSSCISQRHVASRLYNKEGKLLANDSLVITSSQVRKFRIVEDQLVDSLLTRFKFPAIYRENGIQLDLIIDFTLDKNGRVTDVQIVNAHAGYAGFNEVKFKKELQPYYSKQLKDALINMQCANEFKGKNERYYIPVKFSFGTKSERKVDEGWLHVIEPPVPLVDHVVY